MMSKPNICLYLRVHQPTRLRLYRFFDIGTDSHYYDDFANRTAVVAAVENTWLPLCTVLLDNIKSGKGRFKLAISAGGATLELIERYAPEVIGQFRDLLETGCVELVAEPYYHSLSSLASGAEFRHQVTKEMDKLEDIFGVRPETFCNTELIYSDAIGSLVRGMGFKAVITEGAKNVLGWRSSNHVYASTTPGLKLLLRNYSLSDDIAVRFARKDWDEWPLTADKYAAWLAAADGEAVVLAMDCSVFGGVNPAQSGIFDFLRALPDAAAAQGMKFRTPSEIASKARGVPELSIPDAISWAGVESDVSAWLGNELQQEAYNKLYSLTEKLSIIDDPMLWSDFGHLQESDLLYWMNTKFFGDGGGFRPASPYATPYEAFINYMNVLNDFTIRVNDRLASN